VLINTVGSGKIMDHGVQSEKPGNGYSPQRSLRKNASKKGKRNPETKKKTRGKEEKKKQLTVEGAKKTSSTTIAQARRKHLQRARQILCFETKKGTQGRMGGDIIGIQFQSKNQKK